MRATCSGSVYRMASRGENTTRIAQGLLERQAVLADTPSGLGERTDTVGALLRITPHPGVLVVTNEAAAREDLCAILAKGGMPTSAPDGAAAVLQTLRTEQPAIIVTDDHEMTRALRALSPESYIVFLTGSTDSEFEAGIEAGADDCIPRHGTPAIVLARLKIARRTAHMEVSLRRVLHENRQLSTTDPLTKVANRHFFARHFPLEVGRAARYGHSLSLGMCDIDHFKVVNDSYGHAAGDAVLREFGARVQKCVRRGTDWIARVGGEEFAIVLPETDLEAALRVANKIREYVSATPFPVGKRRIVVTASFGVAGLWAVKENSSTVASRLQNAADAALYRSKREGRDRVTAMETPTGAPRSGHRK
jgi:two-component system cell cycle response regulator